jgi:hypothetical protein
MGSVAGDVQPLALGADSIGPFAGTSDPENRGRTFIRG